MKKSLRFCVLLTLAAALLTVSAFADTGPKAQLKVLVKNAPEEPYYLDLLEKGDHQGHTDGSGDGDDAYSGLDWSYSEEEIAAMTAGTPVEWFEESARRCHAIYEWVQPGDELGQEFYNAHAPFGEYQIVLSGYRLASVLNRLFDK